MAFVSDNVLDSGLSYLTSNTGTLHICSQAPLNYTEASSTYTLGNKASPTVGSPVNGDANGRKVVVSAITDGSVTGTGTASHWALVKDTATTELLAWGTLSSSQSVTSGNTFTLTAADITIPDAA